ncbi:MAG: RES family NAD+ phosphorylase [Elusimicrobiota bacterium]
MTIPVRHVGWEPCWRIIPTRYPEEKILEKVADSKDIETVSELEQMTNERLRQERGEVAIVAANDWARGPGSEYIMAPFTYRNPVGSRFSDGAFGVYYAAHSLQAAIEENKHHRQTFMSHTNEGPMRLEMRVLAADLSGDLHDIRGMARKLPRVYSKTSYVASQNFAYELMKDFSYGIAYDSVRCKGGQCVAIFRPAILSHCRPERNLIFEWDGKKIDRVYELREF